MVYYEIAAFILGISFYRILKEYHTLLQLVKAAFSKKDLKKDYGDWAVVTGASDGIGKAYAGQLAERGINIVLIGRNIKKLEPVATDLENRHKVNTKIIIADFSQGRSIYSSIRKELENIPVGILVNNVGIQYEYPMPIADLPDDEIWDNVNVNITSTIMMTRIVLPGMIQRNKGAIVNISSTASQQPIPYMNLYAASKAYVNHFSDGLRIELKRTKITVQTLQPLYVSSKINHFEKDLQKVSVFIPSPETYVKHAVNSLGKIDSTTGYWPHRLQWFVYNSLSLSLKTRILAKQYRTSAANYLKSQHSQQ